jgi:hypothetical protein
MFSHERGDRKTHKIIFSSSLERLLGAPQSMGLYWMKGFYGLACFFSSQRKVVVHLILLEF